MNKAIKIAKDPYVRMLLAAQSGKGVRLTADEVHAMTIVDDMIGMAAEVKLEREGMRAVDGKVVRLTGKQAAGCNT